MGLPVMATGAVTSPNGLTFVVGESVVMVRLRHCDSLRLARSWIGL